MVNVTLLFQVCNFGIAYFCIRHILLEPAVKLILQEQEKQRSLVKAIKEQRIKLEQEEQRKKEVWESWQRTFTANSPLVCSPETPYEYLPIIVPQKPSAEQIENTARLISSALISRVNHVQ